MALKINIANSFIVHCKLLFKDNNNFLRVTCIGHDVRLASSVPVDTEKQLEEELADAFSSISLWKETELMNKNNETVFSIKSQGVIEIE